MKLYDSISLFKVSIPFNQCKIESDLEAYFGQLISMITCPLKMSDYKQHQSKILF